MNTLYLQIRENGRLYESHKRVARMPPHMRFRFFAHSVEREAADMARDPDYAERVTMAYMLEAVAELDDYYQRHIAELDAQP